MQTGIVGLEMMGGGAVIGPEVVGKIWAGKPIAA